MSHSSPTDLAVLACPGGEVFADEVIFHLKQHYRHKFNKTVAVLAKKYSMDTGTVIQRINFLNDAGAIVENMPGSLALRIKIPTRFTMFPNGEIKTEILESIRGKDVYIIQDAENHCPVKFNDGTLDKSLSVNDHLMTVLVTVDAVKQAGADRITLVVPIYP